MPLAQGFDEVVYPGEIEARNDEKYRREGILLPKDTVADLKKLSGQTGVPLLESSLVSFECEGESLHEAGDHFILIGRVVRAQFEPHRDPLLFFRGKYRRLHFA